jgi:hypothetical protein
MTKKTTNLMEVLLANLTDATSKNDSKTESKMKYIYKCHIGTINRTVANMEMEYETGSEMMRKLMDSDNDLDTRGGYGNGAYERNSGFGFPTDWQKLDEYLGELRNRINVMNIYLTTETESYTSRFGELTFKSTSTFSKMTADQKAELNKKYSKA